MLPAYAQRPRWLDIMRASVAMSQWRFSSDRQVEDYVAKILAAAASGPDCCGMEGIRTVNGANPQRFIHSLKYRDWFERDGVFYRNPNHLSPVKRELALKTGFPEINYAEDRDYSARLLPLLKSEVYIDGPIYYYLYIKHKKPALRRVFARVVKFLRPAGREAQSRRSA